MFLLNQEAFKSQEFSLDSFEIFKDAYFIEHLPANAAVSRLNQAMKNLQHYKQMKNVWKKPNGNEIRHILYQEHFFQIRKCA